MPFICLSSISFIAQIILLKLFDVWLYAKVFWLHLHYKLRWIRRHLYLTLTWTPLSKRISSPHLDTSRVCATPQTGDVILEKTNGQGFALEDGEQLAGSICHGLEQGRKPDASL